MDAHPAQVDAPARSRWVMRGALGSIAAGTAVFVLASLLTGGADASPQAAAPAPEPTRSIAPALVRPSSVPPLLTASPTATTKRKSRHKADSRAVTKAAMFSVSGLASNGIPTVALNAYRVAAARMANADPGCGLDWALLAGIGRIESDHGRFGGAVLHTDGTSTPEIIGPALNGHGTALIPATPDSTELSGDATYTRALGPMQFIPQTWAGYGADADGDGRADIFDIDDAALAAARYLCAAGGEVRSHAGAVRAVLAYNHVDAYVTAVLALADAYRRGISISGVPIGNLSGDLPPVKKPKHAANPGGPTAVGGKPGTKHRGSSASPSPSPSGSSSPTSSSSAPSSSHSSSSTPAPSSSGSSSSRPPSSSSSAPSSSSSSAPPSSSSTPPSSSGSSSPTCTIGLGGTCVLP